MKATVFVSTIEEAVRLFNKWAKGKMLTRDVIIHTHYLPTQTTRWTAEGLMIIVIHPEDPFWDKVEESEWSSGVRRA